jgi:hypothetical protein
MTQEALAMFGVDREDIDSRLKNGRILLANLEAPKFRLTHYLSEGTEAWSNPCGNLGFVGGEIGSPTVAHELAITAANEKSLAIFSRVSLRL